MTYTPDIRDYQQLKSNDPNGGVNCTAYCGAMLVDATTAGKTKVTGREVRAATNEPHPDPKSPGLNLPQVDDATRKIAPVNFDTRLGDPILDAETRLRDGRWATVQVERGVLVDHGYGGSNGFRGGHAITVHTNPGDPTPVIGDPLVGWYIRASWGAIWAAAGKIAGGGRANAQFTRDLIPEYEASIHPTPPKRQREFALFHVTNGRISHRELDVTRGFDRPCSPPRWYPWDKTHVGRSLVELLEGDRKGLYIRSQWAKEV